MVETKHKKKPISAKPVLDALKIEAPTGSVERLDLYAQEIVRWGRRINLTGAHTAESFIHGPLYDALTLIPVLEPAGALADVGSGGGLPGIPAALITPGLKVTLVEPRAKRIAFLRHVSYLLGLDVEIIQARVEDLDREVWSAAVAQAVWPPDRWVAKGADLVAPGGRIYALTAAPIPRSQIPAGVRIELEKQFHRPMDNALRISTRLRKTL